MANYQSRYDDGVLEIMHKGHKVTTSVGSTMDDTIVNMKNESYIEGRIPLPDAYRPDQISETFYNTPGQWWYLMHFNNVSDPFEGFGQGNFIKIPIK